MQTAMRAMGLPILILGFASPASSGETGGQSILQDRCGRCHAVTAQSESPVTLAPNLWEKLRSYPPERLEFELAEGMGSRHPDMPQIQFSSEEIVAVQVYLDQNPE